MKMLVEKEKLIKLLNHPDKRVRDAGADALDNFFPNTEGVIEHLIKAINTYEGDCLSLARITGNFIPTNEDVKEIIKLINKTDSAEDDYSMNLYFHFNLSLMDFPLTVLEANRDLLQFNKVLSKTLDVAKNRETVKSRPPKDLWDKLYQLTIDFKNKELEGDDKSHADLLVKGLTRHKDFIKPKIIMHLAQEDSKNYHLEEILVLIAGDLKVEEAVPYLFRIFNNSDFMLYIHSYCIKALGQIGTKEVVDEIARLYSEGDEDNRLSLAEILKYIPYDYSEDLCISLLKKASNKKIRTFLADNLCDIFSLKGSELVLDVIKNKQYDPQVASTLDLLIPVYVYHDKPVDELLSIKEEDKKYQEDTWKNNPLRELTEPIRESIQALEEKEKKVKKKTKLKDNVIPITQAGSKRKTGRRKKKDKK